VNLLAGGPGRLTVYIVYQGTLGASDQAIVPPHSFEFIGLSGPAPTLSFDQSAYRQNGNQLLFNPSYTFTEPFSFTGWRAEFSGPFNSTAATMTYSGEAYFQFEYASMIDRERLVSIVPIPEPSPIALLGFGVTVIVLIKRFRLILNW